MKKQEDPILTAFEETKGEQLDLFEPSEQKEQKAVPKRKKKEKEEFPEEAEETATTPIMEEEPEPKYYRGYDGELYSEGEWFAPAVRNGPTRQEVEGWKERHEGKVYFVPFDSDIFVFRMLQRPEYREIIRDTSLTALDREELFTEKCVLYPYDFSLEKIKKSRAGLASLLSEMIMDKSGFVAQSAPIKL